MTITQVDCMEAAARGYTHVVTIGHADLTDTDTSQTIAIFPDPTTATSALQQTEISCVGIDVTTAFVAESMTDLTLKIGDGVDDDRYFTAALAHLVGASFYSVPAAVTTQPYTYFASDTVDAIFTSTGANLDACTAGEVKIYLKVVHR